MAHPHCRFSRVSAAAILTLLFASITFGQVPDPVVAAQAPQPGSDHGYIGRGAETVTPVDGQVTFDLPIQTPAGRELSFPFGIRYTREETNYLVAAQEGLFYWTSRPTAPNSSVGGWSYDLPFLTGQIFASNVWSTCTPYEYGCNNYVKHQCDAASDFIFRGFDGRQYTLMLGGGPWTDSSDNSPDCLRAAGPTHKGGFDPAAGSQVNKKRTMIKSIDVWKRKDDGSLVRFRCFQILATGKYCVQSADFFRFPIDEAGIFNFDHQFLELLAEESPESRSGGFDSLEEAIANHEKDFDDFPQVTREK